MDAFIYQAALYCATCAERIKQNLDVDGVPPANSNESDVYPQGPYGDGGGESDCPQNCAECHVFLENTLTPDGVKYVIDHLRDYVKSETDGSGEVLDDWAGEVKDYSLDKYNQFVVDAFQAVRKLEGEVEGVQARLSC